MRLVDRSEKYVTDMKLDLGDHTMEVPIPGPLSGSVERTDTRSQSILLGVIAEQVNLMLYAVGRVADALEELNERERQRDEPDPEDDSGSDGIEGEMADGSGSLLGPD